MHIKVNIIGSSGKALKNMSDASGRNSSPSALILLGAPASSAESPSANNTVMVGWLTAAGHNFAKKR
jgi:hypothetical protein